jgi:serine/threonine-protein kinase
VYKVIDFGLASMKASGDETRLTNPAFFLGTLAYAAPEQLRGETVSSATDVYALGVIAYEMLTGARPLDAANRVTLVNQTLTMDPAKPATSRRDLSEAVDRAVMRALAKEPADRWPSATAFLDALSVALGEAPAGPESEDTGLLARYELGPLVARGRLGSLIYRGIHRALGLPVAIRVLKRDEQPHWEAVRARFLLEARTLQVPHPGLLQVRDFGEDERNLYLVTDFIEGVSLREALAEGGAFSWPRASSLIAQALDALSALHRSGGFIAGVNPDMIRLRADVTPTGAAADRSAPSGERIVMSTTGIRSVQDVLATMREQELGGEEASERELPYVAPEVLMGGPPSVRADIFTMGVLAYHMVTGQPPFRARSLPELMGQMWQVKPAAPDALAPGVPAWAGEAILRAITADPLQRFGSAAELAQALRAPGGADA